MFRLLATLQLHKSMQTWGQISCGPEWNKTLKLMFQLVTSAQRTSPTIKGHTLRFKSFRFVSVRGRWFRRMSSHVLDKALDSTTHPSGDVLFDQDPRPPRPQTVYPDRLRTHARTPAGTSRCPVCWPLCSCTSLCRLEDKSLVAQNETRLWNSCFNLWPLPKEQRRVSTLDCACAELDPFKTESLLKSLFPPICDVSYLKSNQLSMLDLNARKIVKTPPEKRPIKRQKHDVSVVCFQ